MKFWSTLRLTAGTTLLVVLVITASGYGYIHRIVAQQREQQVATDSRLNNLTATLASVQESVAALLSANKDVATKLEEERAKRISSEQQAAQANQKIAALQEDIASSKAPNTAAVVSQWRPRVASVRCRFELPDGRTHEDAGSGTLMTASPYPTIVTNRHVVTYYGYTATRCTIQFPDDTVVSVAPEEDILPSPSGIDWAKIYIRKPTTYVASLATGSAPRCTTRSAIGEPLVILGYPSIGSRDDVTVTEGIISGFEDDYYISSAKVERGNSGGAAILTKQNCYLGAPTYVGAGQLETLARILDVEKIAP